MWIRLVWVIGETIGGAKIENESGKLYSVASRLRDKEYRR